MFYDWSRIFNLRQLYNLCIEKTQVSKILKHGPKVNFVVLILVGSLVNMFLAQDNVLMFDECVGPNVKCVFKCCARKYVFMSRWTSVTCIFYKHMYSLWASLLNNHMLDAIDCTHWDASHPNFCCFLF